MLKNGRKCDMSVNEGEKDWLRRVLQHDSLGTWVCIWDDSLGCVCDVVTPHGLSLPPVDVACGQKLPRISETKPMTTMKRGR